MPRYIAFLRGINVGGHRVKMDHLKTLFEDIGLKDVSTFIASGNVLFSSDSSALNGLGERIERHLHDHLGYEVATFLRSPAELAAILTFGSPQAATQEPHLSSHYVVFLDRPAPQSLRSNLTQLNSDMDRFSFSELEVHWQIQGKLSESPLFGPGLDRATKGLRTTTRNINTLRRIAAKTGLPEST